ncbi:MAG: PCRF domain-containing protein [Candidatus Pacebacteria bacterium]|nr:PCRF domain-containing protein [Candidatus Paceibacterota bacterium]
MDLTPYKENKKTAFLAGEYERLEKQEVELGELVAGDPNMGELAEQESESLKKQKENLLVQMDEILEASKEEEEFPRKLMLEVRAGAGGEEAAIFAYNLANMYQKYAEKKGWTVTKIHESFSGEQGGYKEASFEFEGDDVYRELRHEIGVHRIQRVPVTEKSGRIHTSTASVAILPIREKVTVEIDPSDLDIGFSRSGGAGGQNVNKVETAVQILHKPSSIMVRCTSERTQLKNREKAMSILSAKLEQQAIEEEAAKHAQTRKGQIGTGDRSEKIRTYNEMQDRITDHRIKRSWSNYHAILGGGIEAIIETLLKEAEKAGENED